MPSILGVQVDSITRAEAIARVDHMVRDGGQHIITTPNPEIIVAAQKDLEFRAILNRAALALPDGFGLMLAGRFLGTPLMERIAGSDFVREITKLACEKKYKLYLAGGEPGVANAAADTIISRLRNCAIVKSETEPDVEKIREEAPDILLIALGHGKQEKWIAAHLPELPSVKVAMGVGGAFDFIAGRVLRAPRILRRLGLEWLWRLILQPSRLPRIWRAVIKFPILVLRAKLQ